MWWWSSREWSRRRDGDFGRWLLAFGQTRCRRLRRLCSGQQPIAKRQQPLRSPRMPLRLYNTLTHQLEEFRPGDPSRVTFYSCGPTVYDDAHIGNFRSFLAADVLRRWIESPLCALANDPTRSVGVPRTVVHVMNITDVGHMTDDAEGGESGEDRMAVAGRRLLEQKKAGKLPANSKLDPSN